MLTQDFDRTGMKTNPTQFVIHCLSDGYASEEPEQSFYEVLPKINKEFLGEYFDVFYVVSIGNMYNRKFRGYWNEKENIGVWQNCHDYTITSATLMT